MFTKQLQRFYRPSTDLERYDNEEYTRNPLLKFKVSQLNEQRHSLLLKSRAATKKAQTICNFFREPNKNDCSFQGKHSVLFATEETTMPENLERKLENYVPKALKELYLHEYGMLQTAVKNHYQQLMIEPHILNMKNKFDFKLNGRSETAHEKFLSVRSKLAKKLLIMQKPVRSVLNFAAQELPNDIFNLKDAVKNCRATCLEALGERRAVPHRWLFGYIRNEISKMDNFLRWIWYPKLISMLRQQFRKSERPDTKLIKCIEGLIRREITKIKQIWLTNLLNELVDVQKMPVLQMKLEIHNYEIDLYPKLSTILEMYASLLTELANIGVEKLPCLQFEISMGIENCLNQYINLRMDDIYVGEHIADLKGAINQCFKPINDYLENFKANYDCVIKSADIDHYDFLAARHNFEHYVSKMLDYSNHKSSLLLLPKLEYFVIAVVQTTPAVSQLISAAKNFMKLVVDEMIIQHINYLKMICTDYEKIKACASKEPESTEELIQITNYMNLVKDQYLNQLNERVQWARHIGNQLLEFTDFSQYHLNLYVITLNWVNDVKLVYEESAIQLDYFSELFKRNLELRTGKLNEAIEDMCYTVDLLRDVRDSSELKSGGKYAIFLQNIITRLKEFDDAVIWINKEENLLNVTKTDYPKLQEIKIFVSKHI